MPTEWGTEETTPPSSMVALAAEIKPLFPEGNRFFGHIEEVHLDRSEFIGADMGVKYILLLSVSSILSSIEIPLRCIWCAAVEAAGTLSVYQSELHCNCNLNLSDQTRGYSPM